MMLSILTISRYQSEGPVAHAAQRGGEVCQVRKSNYLPANLHRPAQASKILAPEAEI